MTATLVPPVRLAALVAALAMLSSVAGCGARCEGAACACACASD